jgi:hypothetical protein
MKKTAFPGGCIAALVLVLALALSACDGLAPHLTRVEITRQGDGPPEYTGYTPDGRPLVRLTVTAAAVAGEEGTARALNQPLAEAAINYYQVAFYDGVNYYHTAGYKGQTLRLAVPADTYANTVENPKAALAVAGHVSAEGEKTLLAMGNLTFPADGVITGSTTNVTFTLTALTTDVKAANDSTFKIIDGRPTGTPSMVMKTVTYNGVQVPAFKVTKDYSGAKASYGIGGLTDSATAPSAAGTARPFGDMLIAGIGTVTTWSITANTINQSPSPITDTQLTAPLMNGTMANGSITLRFDTPDADCAALISFSLPVVPFNPLSGPIRSWRIRGGLLNHIPDNNVSVGGGIVLLVGALDSL